jgi:hypothetical protein
MLVSHVDLRELVFRRSLGIMLAYIRRSTKLLDIPNMSQMWGGVGVAAVAGVAGFFDFVAEDKPFPDLDKLFLQE